MARKKIVFVIVEGPSDEEALGVILSKLYDPNEVYIQVMHCDITTEEGVHSSNIIANVANIVQKYANNNHYTQKDFKEIIHIVDTDGAYISNESVREDLTLEGTKYSTTEIRTNFKAGIEQRNTQKRGNLNRLYRTKSIWKLHYQIFYMSCNLDHVLYDKLNMAEPVQLLLVDDVGNLVPVDRVVTHCNTPHVRLSVGRSVYCRSVLVLP